MKKIHAQLKSRKLVYVLIFLPAIFLLLLLFTKSVNVPFYDHWELVPIIQHIRAGHFYITDFWWQHNEHRIIIPNIVLTISAMLTHWNTIAECFISFLVSIVSFVLLLKTLGRTTDDLKCKFPLWLPVVLSVIWFSPVQVENWLWGWQLEWFLNVLGVILVAYALSKVKNKDLSVQNLLLAVAGGILAQFSLGNGTILWPVVVIILLYKGIPFMKTASVASVGIITTALYYHHYVTPTYPSKTLFLKQPISFTRYVFVYLGRPLTFLHTGAVVMGAALLVLFLCLNVYLLAKNRAVFNKFLPWLLLESYAIGSACITAVSRLGLGLSQAYSSRYTTIAMLLLIGLVVQLSFLRDSLLKSLNPRLRKLALGCTAIVFVVLILTNVAWGVHSASKNRSELLAIRACTSIENPSNECLLTTYPYPGIVRSRLIYLKQIHWGGY